MSLAPPAPLRIGCWNIKTGEYASDLRRRIDSLSLDVVVLQEVDLWTARVAGRNVARELFGGGTWAWTFGSALQADLAADQAEPAVYGNLVAVRGAIQETLSIDVGPQGANPVLHARAPCDERRCAVLARVRLAGPASRRLIVVGTHLSYGDDRGAVRQGQAHRLLGWVDRFANPADAVVIAGDFNAYATEIDAWQLPASYRLHSPPPLFPIVGAIAATRVGVDHFLVRSAVVRSIVTVPAHGLSDHDAAVLELA